MLRFWLFFLSILGLLIMGTGNAQAVVSQESFEHTKSAFLYADQRNWADAKLHAERSGNTVLQTLVTWQSLLDPDSGAGFDEIISFIEAHPTWPEQKRLRLRAEFSLRDPTVNVDDATLISWFNKNSPISGIGKIAYVKALQNTNHADAALIQKLVREAWQQGDFDEAQEKQLLDDYSNLLRDENFAIRVDRLLWEEKLAPAKRLLPKLSDAQQRIVSARIALIEDKKTAAVIAGQLPAEIKHNPGLLYERMRYKARHNDDQAVRNLLLEAPKEVPYPEKWWPLRERQVRGAIDEGNYSLARKLLANHGQSGGKELAEALWLQGWLDIEFLNQPGNAYLWFYRMFNDVRTPVSKSRAAYWLARAAEKSDKKDTAQEWYRTASQYPLHFYGQLAAYKLSGTDALRIRAAEEASKNALEKYAEKELTRAVMLCMAMGETALANQLVNHLVESAPDEEEAILAAALGKYIGQPYLSVRGAKRALQQHNLILLESGYPSPATPSGLSLPRALTLSIARQESEFDPQAKSSAGALGLMQLLPSTAREVAQKNDLPYDIGLLYESEYNMRLGSLYLSRLIDSYSGSYVLGIAAYNAGPGNVRKWLMQFGTPGSDLEGAINWIEKIPFAETRNYVQRVIENLQIYRHIEAGETGANLGITEDLTR
jgi:soluble lytic murein transglycosylase